MRERRPRAYNSGRVALKTVMSEIEPKLRYYL
jgi:hypothetical protein